MKNIKFIIMVFLLVLFMPFINVNALTYADSDDKVHDIDKYDKYGYVIDAYDIEVEVMNDNVYKVKETISTYFNSDTIPSYGMKRFIPLINNIKLFIFFHPFFF